MAAIKEATMNRLNALLFASFVTCTGQNSSVDEPMDLSQTTPTDQNPRNDLPVASNREEIKSGTRLRLKYIAGEDGSQLSVGLYDTKLGFDCEFVNAEDGKSRCLPKRAASLRAAEMTSYAIGTRYVFKDSTCSDRIAFSNSCDQAVRYVNFADTCGGNTRVANAIEIGMPSIVYYKRSSDGVCTSTSTNSILWADQRFYTLGTSIKPEDFVAGTMMTE